MSTASAIAAGATVVGVDAVNVRVALPMVSPGAVFEQIARIGAGVLPTLRRNWCWPS
jgi:hypothetical protein